jgi:chromosome segregation ATPase
VGASDEVRILKPVTATTRREHELCELVARLEAKLADFAEREQVHELEIAAQRRELAVRFEYEAALEERLRECREQIERLAENEQGRVTAERRRLAGELADEQQRAEHARVERDRVQAELDAERRRVSYRAAQGVLGWLQEHRVAHGVARELARFAKRRGEAVPPSARA